MKNEKLDLSITLCTLNEEKNIDDCLQSLLLQNPSEIIISDGNSNDRTREIATKYNVKIINAGRKGLGHQRKIAVDNCKYKYIAVIDADHRPEKDACKKLIQELEENNFDGIEANILSIKNSSYWDWAMEQNFVIDHNSPGPRNMIGTPCIYKGKILKKINFDPFFTAASDDTDLCYRMCKNGYRLGVGTPIVRQKHRSDLSTFLKKFFWYGKGDAQFVYRHPERLLNMLKHHYFNYPIAKSYKAVLRGNFKVIPFFVFCGLIRNVSFIKEIFKMIFFGKEDKNIYST